MMIKVLFLLENLNGGGAERVLTNLIKYMNKSIFDITVMTLFEDGVNSNLLGDDIKCISKRALHFKGMTYAVKYIPASLLYRHYVGKNNNYDVVVAYMNGLPTKVVSGAKGKKKLAWIHGDMMASYKPQFPKYFRNRAEMLKSINSFYSIVGVSQTICDSFKQYTGVSNSVRLIYNTNDVLQINRNATEFDAGYKKDTLNIVTVGHLSHVKGNDRLLAAANRLNDEGLRFNITIIGEGKDRAALEEYVREKNMQDYINLIGFKSNPYPYVKKSDIFVCPSRSEGLSTAVSEAVILGIPVVSTEVSGAHEILGDNNEYGIVCENSEEGIYMGLKSLISDAALREYYSKKSAERAEFFNPQKTVGDVEELIMETYNA